VFQDLARAHHVGAAVGERDPGGVGPHRQHAVRGGLPQRRRDEVDTDVPVAVDMRREQAGTAPDVDEHRTRPLRGGHQRRTRLRQPVQHRELTVGVPPLRGQVVVLPHVVPGPLHLDRR
jgi:hypothetical protein